MFYQDDLRTDSWVMNALMVMEQALTQMLAHPLKLRTYVIMPFICSYSIPLKVSNILTAVVIINFAIHTECSSFR